MLLLYPMYMLLMFRDAQVNHAIDWCLTVDVIQQVTSA